MKLSEKRTGTIACDSYGVKIIRRPAVVWGPVSRSGQVRSGISVCWSSPFVMGHEAEGVLFLAQQPAPSEPPVQQCIHVRCCVWEESSG